MGWGRKEAGGENDWGTRDGGCYEELKLDRFIANRGGLWEWMRGCLGTGQAKEHRRVGEPENYRNPSAGNILGPKWGGVGRGKAAVEVVKRVWRGKNGSFHSVVGSAGSKSGGQDRVCRWEWNQGLDEN